MARSKTKSATRTKKKARPRARAAAGRKSAGRDRGKAAGRTAAAESSRDRFAFLAKISRALSGSLDYEQTLTTIATLALPHLGAWCMVDVIEPNGDVRRLAVLHPDRKKAAFAREVHRRFPPAASGLIGAPRVTRTSQQTVVLDEPQRALLDRAQDPEHLALLQELGAGAVMTAPMIARDRLVGAITFVAADDSDRFTDEDVVLAEDVASRAAMAVDNARLYGDLEHANKVAEDNAQEAEVALEEARAAEDALREARDTAEAALRSREEFVATMSHEVRTPLNAIVGYADLLDLELAGELSQGQRIYLHRLRDSSRHLLGLVDDVLDLSRSDAGRLTMGQEMISATETAAAAIGIVKPLASGKHIDLIERCLDPKPPQYVGDEHRVRQILVNLLGNAIKFTGSGGQIVLECGTEQAIDRVGLPTGSVVAFHVIDTGRGVAADQADRIFEPFVQEEGGLTRSRDGSGLGLTISRRLARLMGGDVTLEQNPDVRGSNFVLRIPAAGAPEKPIREKGRRQRDQGNKARTGSPTVPHGTPDQRAAARRGLGAASSALLNELGRIVRDFVDRVRADKHLKVASTMTDVEVADHIATLVTDLANSMALLGEAEGEPTINLNDGKKIQRLIGELHGAQRQRLGWKEADLEREGEIVRSVCEAAILRLTRADSKGAKVAQTALAQLLAERTRAGLNGYREAARGG